MDKRQLALALAIAESPISLPDPGGIFDGFGLKDFKPVHVTLKAVAYLIRWQCFPVFGGDYRDTEALNDIAYYGRQRFIIIDDEHTLLSYTAELMAKRLTANTAKDRT